MLVLGIESSCDETAVAVVERGAANRVIVQRVKSQIDLHSRFGGVVPEIAARNHYEVIDLLLKETLQEAGVTLAEIELIAVTQGPGLIGSLLVGLTFAKALAFSRKIPLIGVDHILAHNEAAFITNPEISFPLIALIVSGGHTTIFYFPQRFQPELISKTRDDAAGELLDKICKFFQLGYPGGPIIDRLYNSGDDQKFSFTFPQMSDGSADFSFSGYKTAVLSYSRRYNIQQGSQEMLDLLASLLSSVVNYLFQKTLAAAIEYGVENVVVSGGVSCNSLLRKRFGQQFEERKKRVFFPAPAFTTDNAAMIAYAGYERYIAFPHDNYSDLTLNAYGRAFFRQNRKHR